MNGAPLFLPVFLLCWPQFREGFNVNLDGGAVARYHGGDRGKTGPIPESRRNVTLSPPYGDRRTKGLSFRKALYSKEMLRPADAGLSMTSIEGCVTLFGEAL